MKYITFQSCTAREDRVPKQAPNITYILIVQGVCVPTYARERHLLTVCDNVPLTYANPWMGGSNAPHFWG
jgi:hypothetical protein